MLRNISFSFLDFFLALDYAIAENFSLDRKMLDIRSRAGVAITNNKKTVMNGDNDNDESIINCDDKINRANKILVHRRRRRRQLHESINGGGGDSGDTRLPRQFDYIHKDHSYCLLPTTTTRIHVPTVAKMSHRDMETKREDNESDDNDDDDDSGASSSICYYDNYNKKLGNDHKNSRNIIRLSISNSSGVYEREGIVRALCKKFAMNEHTIDREEQEEVKNDPSDLFIDSASSSSSSSSISSNMEELLPGLVRSKIDQFNGVNKETDLRSGITYRYDLNQSTATDVTTATSSSSSSSSTTTASSTTDPDSVSMNYYNNMDFSGENTVSNTSLLDRSDSTLTSSCANSDSYSTHLPNTSPSQLPDHTPSFSSSSFFPSSNSNSQKDSLGLSYFRSRNFEESYVKIKELFVILSYSIIADLFVIIVFFFLRVN